MSGEIILELKNVSKQFGGLRAVNGVSLSVSRGSLVSIIGPNGAGKSTLFNLITGLHRASEGQTFFKGLSITNCKPHHICRLGLTRTFQTTQLFTEESVLDNVLIARHTRINSGLLFSVLRGRSYRLQEEKQREKARELLEFIDLAGMEGHPAGVLPPEGRQRLAIAMTLACDPEMILFDEPFGGLTEEEGERLSLLLSRVNSRGITICLIEHKMRMVMRLSSRIFVLNYGEKIAEGSPKEIQKNPKVVEAYLGRSSIA